jgi:hypothetical protein
MWCENEKGVMNVSFPKRAVVEGRAAGVRLGTLTTVPTGQLRLAHRLSGRSVGIAVAFPH